jgi:hypothetical protein
MYFRMTPGLSGPQYRSFSTIIKENILGEDKNPLLASRRAWPGGPWRAGGLVP